MKKPLNDRKKQYIQLIHVAKSKLGLEDDVYREILSNETGKHSTKDMNYSELVRILNRLKRIGFTVQPNTQMAELADTPQNKLILHLWNTLHKHDEVKNPSEHALLKFIQRHCKDLKSLNELTSDQASKIIEHLKNWCERADINYR